VDVDGDEKEGAEEDEEAGADGEAEGSEEEEGRRGGDSDGSGSGGEEMECDQSGGGGGSGSSDGGWGDDMQDVYDLDLGSARDLVIDLSQQAEAEGAAQKPKGGRKGKTAAAAAAAEGAEGDDSTAEGRRKGSRCALCGAAIDRYVLGCHCCAAEFHIQCLGDRFAADHSNAGAGGSSSSGGGGGGAPWLAGGACPACSSKLDWLDLVVKMKGYGGAAGEPGGAMRGRR
jgi:hypothetical protein